MRELSLLRHAKSSWDDEHLADFDRPLAPRGLEAAPLMGRHMGAIGLAPERVVCSPAVRTRETARLALAELPARPPVTFDPDIYEAGPEQLRTAIARTPSDVGRLLLIGHNPGLQELTLWLTGGRLPDRLVWLAQNLPTGSLVVLDVDAGDWGSLSSGCASVRHAARPRRLRNEQ
jgi:phosphohistidine phosphatase